MLPLIKKMSKVTSASRGTSLITMLSKPGTELSLTSNKLISEMLTAANIKSKTVRKDVKTALKAAQYLIKNS